MSCPIHGAEWWALQKRLLPTLLEVCWRGRSQICSRRGAQGSLRRSHGGKVPCQKDHEGRLFLALNATRRSRFRQEMWQLPKVWECPTSPSRENDDHFLTLAICIIGDRHYGPPTTRKEASEIFTRRNRLLHEMGGSRSTGNNTETKVQNFVWKNILCRFGIPRTIISDNGRQFDSHEFTLFSSSLGIKNKYSSPGHPQANGQTEVINWSLLKIIKSRLVGAKGAWPEELPGVLWAYKTTAQTPIG